MIVIKEAASPTTSGATDSFNFRLAAVLAAQIGARCPMLAVRPVKALLLLSHF